MTRIVPVIVLVVSLVMSRSAGAQTTTGMLPNNANIVFEHRAIFDPGNKAKPFFEPQAGSTELLRYFNLAHCNCARAAFNANTKNTAGTFHYIARETAQSLLHVPVNYYAGTTCDQAANRPGGNSVTCKQLTKTDSNNDLDANLYPGGEVKDFNLYEVVNGTKADGTTACLQLDSANNSIYALVDTNGATNYNYSSSVVVGKQDGDTTTGSGADTKPPSLPRNLKADPGEGEIDLSWDPPSSNSTDIVAYQALCLTLDGNAARETRSNDPRYVTTRTACVGVDVGTDADTEKPVKTVLDNGETAVDPVTNLGAFGLLDAKYICGEAPSGTATSLAIKDLQNGIPYQVILLSIDLHGNFAATYFDHTITPVPVTDFWEVLHKQGSEAQGGLCLLAETYGDDSGLTQALRTFRDDTLGRSRAGRWLSDVYYATLGKLGSLVHGSLALRILAGALLAPAVGFALLWHWLTLPGTLGLIALAWWLRRRWRAGARGFSRQPWHISGLAVSALIVLGASDARADSAQPYWDDAQQFDAAKEEVPLGDPSLVTWHAGVRLGPYIPGIDSQLSVSPAPYEQMFGGYHMLTMLDVHRIVWTGFGQIGVGGSIGYWQKTARPFVDGADLTQPNPQRQPGNKTAFRLVPTELTATYRLTVLDDDYGVPVVPYVRGGLAYYIWWMTAPSGNFSRICNAAGQMCGDKALGASLGVTGAIGLAIRAERIDATAAMSMRQSGIQHAGIYAELSLAKVDGFGSDKKLSVGDRTWFAGVDFEF